MNKNIIIGVIVLLVIVAAWFISQGSKTEPALVQQTITNNQLTQDTSNTGDETALPEVQGGVKEFIVNATNFKFSLDEIRVGQGDTVRIVFVNGDGTHAWKIDEFNVATNVIQTGEDETIEFVADQAGRFEYYCSVGEHRELGMHGTLIVE